MINVIILAAGKGTRMKSDLPKTLHKLLGKTMLDMVCDLGLSLGKNVNVVAVISDEMDAVLVKNPLVNYVIQKERLGTGHAVKVALDYLNINYDKTLILYGDTPLISKEIVQAKIDKLIECALVAGAFDVADINQKYGRLITDGDKIKQIIEYKNATQDIRNIRLCNSGIYSVKTAILSDLVNKIEKNELSQEYYLTDLIELANKDGLICKYIKCNQDDLLGVNSQKDLSVATEKYQDKLRDLHIENGVKMIDPKTVYFWDDTKIEAHTTIEPFVVFGANVEIGANCRIKSHSNIEGCKAENDVVIGPFARIRPDTILKNGAKIGNFVEIKNSIMSNKSKVNHLSYIGDSQIGDDTNFGAGSITCNYDGFKKHKTIIGDNTLIGANCSLVAPVNIGNNCVIGAGSVITKSVPNGDLAVTRGEQKVLESGGIKYNNKKNI
jgi:bifunctional UDP-N-acetylglucosamine pyrophosphorylase/glucosamine-1-phosphate N-acetyltransferase